MATQSKKKPETMSLRIPVHRIEDLRLIGEIEEREIPWMLRRAIDDWCDRYFKEHPSALAQQAPDPVVTAPSETEMLKARIAELEAKLARKNVVTRTILPPVRIRRSVPNKGESLPAAAVPPTSISKHSVKH